MRLLTRKDIVQAIETLAEELKPMGASQEIFVLGGAALVLLYNAREATRDVDMVAATVDDLTALRAAAQRVSATLGLPEDWLNDGAKGYLQGLSAGEVLFESSSLIVRTLSTQQLLAMKLSAWRDDVDIADARLLLSKLPGGSLQETWNSVEPYLVPGRELKARYAFEDIWESLHGSS